MDRRMVGMKLLAVGVASLLLGCGEKPEALLGSARGYLEKKDPKAAIIQIKNALQQDPNLAEARFLLGKALFDSGDAAGAVVELRKALDAKYPADEVVPPLAQALVATGQAKSLVTDFAKIELKTPEAKADLQTSLAVSHVARGEMAPARKALAAALEIKPDLPRALMVKAQLAVVEQDLDGALQLAETVLAKDPGNAEALKLKGDILFRQGKADGALAAYRQATEKRPDFALAHAALMMALLQQGKVDEAGRQLEVMKKSAAKSRTTLMAEAGYWFEAKELKKAQEALQELLKGAPNDPGAVLLSGIVHYRLNSLVQAEDYLSRAVKQDPASVQARRILAVTQLRLGQPAKALAALEPLLDDIGDDANLNALAGEIYMQNGDPRRAETYFARAATLDPKDVAKKTSVALTHLASGRSDQGLGELERIASADTGTTADMALISSAMRRKDYAKALKAIDVLEKKQPDSPLVPTLRGTVHSARGDLSAARKSYERALALKPAYFPAAASLAAMDLREKKPDDARKRFQGVLAADPKNVQALLALAEIAGRSGASADDVAAQISKAVQAVPSDPAPRLALVSHHLAAKDAKKAIAAAQDALGTIPDEPRLLDALARAQMLAGDANQALATLHKVEALLPNSPQLQVRIAEMQFGAKDKAGAEKSLRKALGIRADYLPAQRGLITLAMEAGKADEAKSILRDIRKQRPKEGVADLIEGDLAAARKAWPEAVAAYRAGLAATPTTELAAKLYSALIAAGKASDAERFAERWIAEHEADAGFRLHLADAANRQKDYARAARHYQMVVQHQPGNVFVLNNLAWSLGQMRDPRALEYAERAAKLAPDSPAVLDTLGLILADKGDLPRAIEVLRKAVESGPQLPLVRLTLAKTYLKAGNKPEAKKQLEELAKLGDAFPAQAEVTRLLKDAGG